MSLWETELATLTRELQSRPNHLITAICRRSYHFRFDHRRAAIKGLIRSSSIIIIILFTISSTFLSEYHSPVETAYAQAQDSPMKIFFLYIEGGGSSSL